MPTMPAAAVVLYRFGLFEVDPARGELRKRGVRRGIQEKPLQVLLALLERPGELVTRQELCARLWPPGVHVEFDESLNAAVKRLRRALGDAPEPPRFVETVPRHGYRLLVPVERVEAATAAAPPEPAVVAAVRPARRPRRLALAAAGGGLLLASLGLHASARAPMAAATRPLTLAVLPFQNLDGDPSHDYLGDGLTEELITQLGRLQPARLGVVARTSAMRYRGATRDVKEIAADLGADYVLEGSVRTAGGRVRVAARLVEARRRTQVWSEAYDRPLLDVVQAELEVSRAVARTLAAGLLPGEPAALARAGTASGEAYDAYLRGLFELRRGTSSGFEAARAHFTRALAADASCALAQWGLSQVWLREAKFRLRPPEESYGQAVAAALRAVALDGTLPQAHTSLAEAHHLLGNRAEAARAFARGLQAGPLPTEGRVDYAWFLHDEGRDPEALDAITRALELDPASVEVQTARAHLLLLAGQADAASRQAEAAVAQDPSYPYAHYAQGLILEQLGRRAEAVAAFERAHAMGEGAPKYALRLGVAYADAGRAAEARRMLAEARAAARERYVKPDDLECLSSRLSAHGAGIRSGA